MGENQNHPPRLRTAAADVFAGGHIVRSTGRKDRHSKVCTAKGPRDRRVRLAAHTAIQFYDVQDRLGYDRPSKAVDWLIKKAKPAIDELAQLPAWKPIQNPEIHGGDSDFLNAVEGSSGKRAMVTVGNEKQSFLPASMDSDTIKSFLPIGGASPEPNSSAIQFHSQDLRLSLQSFQDPTILLLHHHHHRQNPPPPSHGEPQDLFTAAAATQLVFNASDHHEHYHRLPAWNSSIASAATSVTAADGGGGNGGGRVTSETEGYLFNSPAPAPPQTAAPELYEQVFGGERQYLCSQREPLQSSNNTPWIRAWTEPSPATAIAAAQHQITTMLPFYPSPLSTTGGGFATGLDGFSGFRIPARIQGDEQEEEHDGISDKLFSASSDSCH